MTEAGQQAQRSRVVFGAVILVFFLGEHATPSLDELAGATGVAATARRSG